jgi:DNA polymerase-3 subunit delta
LITYIERPAETTIFCIAYKHKRFNFNSKFGKALKKHAVVMESKRLYDNQVPDWIQSYLRQKKLKIQALAANLLAEYLGTDLSKIANELDKLAINLPVGTEIDSEIIETNIGISKEYNVFEFQRALGQRDPVKANRIVQYFIANPKKSPLPMIMGTLYNFFSKAYMLYFLRHSSDKDLTKALNLRSSFFLKEYKSTVRNYSRRQMEDIFQVLKEYDLKSKGVDYVSTGKKDGELLREMVWKILH